MSDAADVASDCDFGFVNDYNVCAKHMIGRESGFANGTDRESSSGRSVFYLESETGTGSESARRLALHRSEAHCWDGRFTICGLWSNRDSFAPAYPQNVTAPIKAIHFSYSDFGIFAFHI